MKTIKFTIWYAERPKNIKGLIRLAKLVIRQKITELWCKKKHNKWIQTPLNGAGKYIYNVFQCDVCNRVHISFVLNK